jgi:hypothetical protein
MIKQTNHHVDRMIAWIDRVGLIVIHAEIKPYGKGTRRYIVGRHIEQPDPESYRLPSGKWCVSQGKQEWLTPVMNAQGVEQWLRNYDPNSKEVQYEDWWKEHKRKSTSK